MLKQYIICKIFGINISYLEKPLLMDEQIKCLPFVKMLFIWKIFLLTLSFHFGGSTPCENPSFALIIRIMKDQNNVELWILKVDQIFMNWFASSKIISKIKSEKADKQNLRKIEKFYVQFNFYSKFFIKSWDLKLYVIFQTIKKIDFFWKEFDFVFLINLFLHELK